MVEFSKPSRFFKPIRCDRCEVRDDEPSRYRRIPAKTRLEQFLQSRGLRMTALHHASRHISEHLRLPDISTLNLLDFRKGTKAPTPDQQEHIALAVSNVLGEQIPVSALFENAARRQA
jgi:hypothetical protein